MRIPGPKPASANSLAVKWPIMPGTGVDVVVMRLRVQRRWAICSWETQQSGSRLRCCSTADHALQLPELVEHDEDIEAILRSGQLAHQRIVEAASDLRGCAGASRVRDDGELEAVA